MGKKNALLPALLLTAVLLSGCAGSAEAPTAPETPETHMEQPDETPAPTTTEPTPLLPTAPVPTPEETGEPLVLTAQQQYEANLFLSNFSEQGFCGGWPFESFDAAAATDAQLFQFAHLWAKINRRADIAYEDNYETMTRSAVNAIIDRYLDVDRTLDPTDGTEYSAELGMGRFDWDRCWYKNGRFYYPAADGESHTGFSVVSSATRFPNNWTAFRFTVYTLDLQIYWDNNGIPALYYRLTPEEAARRAAAGEISPEQRGTALCSPLLLMDSGRESYRLIRYTLDP